MRRIASILSTLIVLGLYSQKTPQAMFEVAKFQSTDFNPYIESYLNVFGSSLKWVKAENGFQATVEIEYLFYSDTLLKKASKIKLSSPVINDTNGKVNFLDVQRFALLNGEYKMMVHIKDVNVNSKKATLVYQMNAIAESFNPIFSDIEYVENMKASTNQNSTLYKSGYEMSPFVASYYNTSQKEFTFYTEIYNVANYLTANALPTKAILSYGIFKGSEALDGYGKQQRIDAKNINVSIGKLNISELPTGNYDLKFKLQDANGQVIAEKSKPFVRINANIASPDAIPKSYVANLNFPYNIDKKDSLKHMILSLHPIAGASDYNTGVATIGDGDIKKMQNFLFNFWSNKDPKNPELAYYKYAEQVYNAQVLFGGPKLKGYLTERGRVYLQYGPPDAQNAMPMDVNNYPYEIWQYYRTKDLTGQQQTNRMFVFADFQETSLGYKLIHSTARGEMYDARWQIRLQKRMYNSVNLDDTEAIQGQGNNANELFNNPR
jgi:GWxTD domain-containing protein